MDLVSSILYFGNLETCRSIDLNSTNEAPTYLRGVGVDNTHIIYEKEIKDALDTNTYQEQVKVRETEKSTKDQS